MKNLKNKKLAILGLGINNIGLIGFLLEQKISFTICDKDLEAKKKYSKFAKSKLISWRLGKDYLKKLIDFNIVFRTPGLPYLTLALQQAKKKGVEISSQTKLFFDLCPCKIIGVTGTKGKGTTTTLIHNILKASGKKVYLAGNIGKDPFEFLAKLKKDDWVCLEISSFQLQDLHKSPHIGVVLMITQEHLDHHQTRKEYVESKTAIVKWQKKSDFAVVNFDYPSPRDFARMTRGRVYFFSRYGKVDKGVYVEDGKIILMDKKKKNIICKTSELKLRGQHNWENITAAITASYLVGAKLLMIKKKVVNFKGLEHRLELVSKKKGISYYNDSFATVPESTIAAVKSFKEPVILICGGSKKGSDYFLLGEVIKNSSVKAVILIGKTAKKIKSEILKQVQDDITIIEGCKNMDEIFTAIKKVVRKGDVVLLSPACASFGMFKNYKDRGEQFKKDVKKIK